MEITHTLQGAILVVAVTGSLDALTAPEVEAYMLDLVAAGHTHLVFDLTGLEYSSSAGLRVMLGVSKATRQHGGDLRLAGVNHNVLRVLEMSGFTSILKIYPDVAAAVAGYE